MIRESTPGVDIAKLFNLGLAPKKNSDSHEGASERKWFACGVCAGLIHRVVQIWTLVIIVDDGEILVAQAASEFRQPSPGAGQWPQCPVCRYRV